MRSKSAASPTLVDLLLSTFNWLEETFGNTGTVVFCITMILCVFGGTHHFSSDAADTTPTSTVVASECHTLRLRDAISKPSVERYANSESQAATGPADCTASLAVK